MHFMVGKMGDFERGDKPLGNDPTQQEKENHRTPQKKHRHIPELQLKSEEKLTANKEEIGPL